MRLIRRRELLLAVALSGIAGFVDAIGFVHLGGYFLSFMSGNTTRMAAGTAQFHWDVVSVTAGLLAAFFAGVIAGAVTARFSAARAGVLWLVSAMMLFAAGLAQLHVETVGLAMMASAMGAMNSVFQRDGEVTVGLTYMTGTLVKAGQRLVDALAGGPRWLWLRYLILWLGLTVGAVLGALAYRGLGIEVLWLAAALLTAVAAAVTLTLRRRQH
ncbi:YoaK family protein [Gordonia sp. ABSL11-1]|uniref:YoaK family protein n=1 Tax=Gordonia sp. ABSL11-1 TaxID=3053924 RepID=UPI0025740601|nr:YoaK family protein [Gordonia sp. ABSL11-1]MDL9949060.1 YoaK family protein [Gordonia sp. ABSL11-1]